ncbi:MAG TPA: LysE family translocator [Streptosporangiaceae bacterium]|nr:LysE family translocator [Streptosporangiaceae bacterium]
MPHTLIAFVGAAVVVAMVPGPSTVMIMREAARSGRRAGAATILGNETGVLAWGLAAAFGLSALLIASQVAYDAMRVIGAGVLIYFGAKSLWQVRKGASPAAAGQAPPGGSLWRSFRIGVVTNAANPKAGVFAVSFLPQFVPDGAPILATLVLFSVTWALIDTIWYLGVVWMITKAKRVIERPDVRRRLEQVSGVILVGLGIRLAAEAR